MCDVTMVVQRGDTWSDETAYGRSTVLERRVGIVLGEVRRSVRNSIPVYADD